MSDNEVQGLDAQDEKYEITNREIIVVCKDDKEVKINSRAAALCGLLRDLLLADPNDQHSKFEVKKVGAASMRAIAAFAAHHVDKPYEKCTRPVRSSKIADFVKNAWDAEWVDALDDVTRIYDVVEAADFLRIDTVLDLCATKVCTLMWHKSPAEVKQALQLKEDIKEEDVKFFQWPNLNKNANKQ